MKELKAPDKVAQKMTRDGAVAENLATAEAAAERISQAGARRSAKKQTKAEAETIREGSAAKQRPSSRLRFTEEERADPALQKYIRRSDRATDKLDAAKEAIPTKKVLKTERIFNEAAVRGGTCLTFEEVEKRPNGKLQQPPFPSHPGNRPCRLQRSPQGGAGKCGCGGRP